MIESVQVGMANKVFSGGWLANSDAYDSEHLIGEFEDWVLQTMNT